ncbi:Gfo/Idh/MocA family oxidoreductase [Dactylosporangium roseum]|uniref:Gfo/Idh/MocA family oxidoreductase n=1 Tax=Dactylosporangium roseum TaxID=47989 RepID=A0ABY5Z1T2_9ACTN|nr:Gfo/Idh/MocA family oxidoreductase [Dactylosporangium roseum]UWZ34812.1 Gfo/Idh/MocA family oxidoreductase [Dactylosporangium roseum]
MTAGETRASTVGWSGGHMRRDVQIGVVGAGAMGTEHIRLLSEQVPGARVTVVHDPDPARVALVRQRFPHVLPAPTSDELINAEAVDAIVIAAPDEDHESLVLRCLEAGKPVLCEKPLASDSAGCLRVVQREAELGRQLVRVGLMRRFDPVHRAVRDQLADGAVGEPVAMHCTHRVREVPAWFTGDMTFTNAAVHDIDVVRWILGTEIASVTVHSPSGPAVANAAFVDPQIVVFETLRGTVVTLELFLNARFGYQVTCEVVGTSGVVSTAQVASPVLLRQGRRSSGIDIGFQSRFASAYQAELTEWTRAVGGGDQPGGATAWDGYLVTVTAETCVRAAREATRVAIDAMERPALYDPRRDAQLDAV